MYKNAHLQNITPGAKLGMEQKGELISQSCGWPGRREENCYLWFFNRDDLNYVGRPSPRSRPSGVTSADPHTKLAPFNKESNL